MFEEKATPYRVTHRYLPCNIRMKLAVLPLILFTTLTARAATGTLVAHNTPPFVFTAKNLGAVDPAKTIEVSVWTNVHNRSEMDATARNLYDRASPIYRHWLTRSQIAARFAPTAEETKTVQRFLESHNLKLVRIGANNFFLRARGTVDDVEKAFHVQLNNYQVHDKVIRANANDPYVEGPAGVLAAYAALWEPEIAGVILNKPPLSHMEADAPALLNVLRVCDIPEVLGMLAPRPVVVYAAPSPSLDKTAAIFQAAGAAGKFSRKKDP